MPSLTQPTEDINKYFTWSNAFKFVAILCSFIWFLSGQFNSNAIRDLQLEQSKKDLADIKSILRDIQVDFKTINTQTDARLNALEQEVKVMKSEQEFLKAIK